MKKQFFIIALMMIIMTTSVLAACGVTTSDGSDFMQINQSSYNTIAMSDNEKFNSFEFFTPRLNFSHTVYENIVGQLNNSNYTISWTMVGNDTYTSVNSSFVLLNSSGGTIPATNYTLYSTNNRTFILNFRTSNYNGTLLLASWTRQFVKNVDDLYLNASGLSSLYSFSTFIQSNSPTSYGDDKSFRPNPSTYAGNSINLSNWAVGWNYDDNSNCTACTGVNPLLMNTILTMFILGMLVFLGFSIYSGTNVKSIIAIAIGFLIMIIGLLILKGVLSGVCVV